MCHEDESSRAPPNRISARDPDATVVHFPFDHFVYLEDRFLDIVRVMTGAARRLADKRIRLAVTPDRPEIGYGWIESGGTLMSPAAHEVRSVRRFIEKPGKTLAAHAMAVVEADRLLWSDWGQPEHIADTLLRMGRKPAFPLEMIAGATAIQHAS